VDDRTADGKGWLSGLFTILYQQMSDLNAKAIKKVANGSTVYLPTDKLQV